MCKCGIYSLLTIDVLHKVSEKYVMQHNLSLHSLLATWIYSHMLTETWVASEQNHLSTGKNALPYLFLIFFFIEFKSSQHHLHSSSLLRSIKLSSSLIFKSLSLIFLFPSKLLVLSLSQEQ